MTVVMHLKEHNIVIPIDTGPSNLPIVWNPSVSREEQQEIGLTFISKLGICDLPGMSSVFPATSPHSMQPALSETLGKPVGRILCVSVLALMKTQIFWFLRKNC